MGPLLYVLFTNDLPEAIHDHLNHDEPVQNYENISEANFSETCQNCGKSCCYADDSTYSKSHKNPIELKTIIDEKYNILADYMHNNKLILNSDKTHLMIMTSDVNHRKHGTYDITLNTGTEIIKPDQNEFILGGTISDDLKWKAHILYGKKSLVKMITTRINALRKVSRYSNFRVRKMIGNGIVMGKFIYLIQLWGGCSEFLLTILQKQQNKAARIITKLEWNTPVSTLLKQCGWLSIRQLARYHSLLQVYKIKQDRKPEYFFKKFSKNFPYRTRLSTVNGIKQDNNILSDLTKKNFTYRAISDWNLLPAEIRQVPKLPAFKKQLKNWIKQHVPVD